MTLKFLIFFILFCYSLSASFYRKPDIFPYRSLDDLKRETKNDPFGIDYTSYKFSYELIKTIQENPQHPASAIEIGFIPKSERIVGKKEDENSKINVQADSGYLYGVVNLEEYSEIEDVMCSSNEIKIKSKHFENIKEWIPGSRLIISEKFSCSKSKGEPRVFFMKKRTSLSKGVLSCEIEEIGILDTLSFASVTAFREIEKNPAGLKIGLFNFNYDNKNKCVLKPNMDLYRDKYFSVVCRECYTFVEADISLQFKFQWKKGITYQKTEIVGYTESIYKMLADANYAFQKQFEVTPFTLPNALKIRFSIGPVPIWIDFDLLLKLKANIDLSAGASIEFGAKFWDKLTLGMIYDGSLPKDQRFKFYKDNSHSDFKDLIPYPTFKASFDFNGKAQMYPEIIIRFFSTCQVRLGALPYMVVNSNSQVEIPTLGSCPKNELFFQLDYGLNWYIQMMVLKFMKFTSDLGGLLPYPSPLKEFVIIPQKTILKKCLAIPKKP